ncbi:hypothetical protein AAFF_G00130110 [Aldrovandia affinis]|uniref:Uncharacterized protein n=1 Tax=Aldrovandia affinis TaxID=143900 RepID=A0AAD7RQZ1_9TELE|nr:hypothetical protein AAFF_G00130110 [Aldrovandia affinis]
MREPIGQHGGSGRNSGGMRGNKVTSIWKPVSWRRWLGVDGATGWGGEIYQASGALVSGPRGMKHVRSCGEKPSPTVGVGAGPHLWKTRSRNVAERTYSEGREISQSGQRYAFSHQGYKQPYRLLIANPF